jgi:hypothetical protein
LKNLENEIRRVSHDLKQNHFFEDKSLWRLTTLVESEETNTQETKGVLMLSR